MAGSPPGMALWIKVCGITCVEDAWACASKPARTRIGVNFVESSKRRVDAATGRASRDAVGGSRRGGRRGRRSLSRRARRAPRAHGHRLAPAPRQRVAGPRSRAPAVTPTRRCASRRPPTSKRRGAFPASACSPTPRSRVSSAGPAESFDWTLVTRARGRAPARSRGGPPARKRRRSGGYRAAVRR